MKNIPVDTQGMEFRAAEDAQPKMVNRETGETKINKQGVPVYELIVMVRREGRRPELLTISFPSPTIPEVHAGEEVRLHQLTGFYWENNGRSGVSFSVAAVEPVAVKTAKAA